MFIFADATLFTQNKAIPSLPNDTIVIDVPYAKGKWLRSLSHSECDKHFPTFHPSLFIILTHEGKPRYSSFLYEFNTHKPIELSPSTQRALYDFTHATREISGRISRDGHIDNIKQGTSTWCPPQPGRTETHISFHVHPKSTYKQFNANYGWPSASDMNEIQVPPKNTTNAHIVISIEGLYLVSLKTCLSPHKGKVPRQSFQTILDKCSWILLPWQFSKPWFIF